MSDDPRHDNRVGAVSGGSVGNAHGPLTINNFNQAPPTPTDGHPPDPIEPRLALPDPPQSLYSPSRSPYPLFRPYDDPALFAGRDADIAALLVLAAPTPHADPVVLRVERRLLEPLIADRARLTAPAALGATPT